MRRGPRRVGRLFFVVSLAATIFVVGLALKRVIHEEWLIRQLQAPGSPERILAARGLAELNSGRAIPRLLEAAEKVGASWKDGSLNAEAEAMTLALEQIATQANRSIVLEALQGENPWAMWWALGKLSDSPRGAGTLEALRTRLASLETVYAGGSQSAAVGLNMLGSRLFDVLGLCGRPGAALSAGLLESQSKFCRQFNANVLGQIGPNAKAHRSLLLGFLRGRLGASDIYFPGEFPPTEIDSHFAVDLLDDLRGADSVARERAWLLLSSLEVEDAEVFRFLHDSLDGQAPLERLGAAITLARNVSSGDHLDLDRLRTALSNADPQVRLCAAAAITRSNDAATNGLAELLGQHSEQQPENSAPLLIGLEDKVFHLRLETLLALSSTQKAALGHTLSPNPCTIPEVWAAVLNVQWEPSNETARASLFAALRSSEPTISLQAVRLFISCFTSRPSGLSKSLVEELEREAKAGSWGASLVAKLLGNRYPFTAMAALSNGEATSNARAPEWKDVQLPPGYSATLLDALNRDKSPVKRATAATAIGALQLSPAEVVPALLTALRDRSLQVRRAACESLARIRPRGLGVAGALASEIRKGGEPREMFRALEALGDEAVPCLAGLLEDADPEIRTLAAWTTGRLRSKAGSAVPALGKALADDSDPITRWTAAEALGRIGQAAHSEVGALRAAARSEDAELARYALGALRRLGQ